MAWLNDNPPARSQFRHPRREEPSGTVAVHTAENVPDFVAFDGGAEAVARFIRDRDTPGSYHELVDSDSGINLVDYNDEAFHDGTGTNPHSFGLSVATRADVWPLAPPAWRAGAIEQAAQRAARYARWLKARRGIVIPARRITAVQARARVPGFVTHAELDPTRRTDPGKAFPFAELLERFAELTATNPTPPHEENEDMPYIIRGEGYATRFVDAPLCIPIGATAYTGLTKAGVKVYPLPKTEATKLVDQAGRALDDDDVVEAVEAAIDAIEAADATP